MSLSDLQQPEQLYRKLGAKLVVGMPFKDIATSDSIFMRQLPSPEDKEARRALKRLQDVGVHVLTPAAELAAKPLAGAVAVSSLKDALAAGMTRHVSYLPVLEVWSSGRQPSG